jgi:hypothetical protein
VWFSGGYGLPPGAETAGHGQPAKRSGRGEETNRNKSGRTKDGVDLVSRSSICQPAVDDSTGLQSDRHRVVNRVSVSSLPVEDGYGEAVKTQEKRSAAFSFSGRRPAIRDDKRRARSNCRGERKPRGVAACCESVA